MPGGGEEEEDLLLDPYPHFDNVWDHFATSFGADGQPHAPARTTAPVFAPAVAPLLQNAIQQKLLARLHNG